MDDFLDELLAFLLPLNSHSNLLRTGERLLERFLHAPNRVGSFALLGAIAAGTALGTWTGLLEGAGFVVVVVLAGLAIVGARIRMDVDELVVSPPVRVLLEVLEPQEPPEHPDGRELPDPVVEDEPPGSSDEKADRDATGS